MGLSSLTHAKHTTAFPFRLSNSCFFGIIANADSVIYINLYGAQFFFFFFYILCALISENSLKIGSTRTFIKSARYRAEMLKI